MIPWGPRLNQPKQFDVANIKVKRLHGWPLGGGDEQSC